MNTERSTIEALRGSRVVAYTLGAILLVAGLILMFWPDRTLTVVARLTGILLVVLGAGDLIDDVKNHHGGTYGLLLALRGGLNVVFGLILVFWPHVTVRVVVWVFGLSLVLTGVACLLAARGIVGELRRATFIRGVVTTAFGLAIMIWPSATLKAVAFLAASLLIVVGLFLLWSGYMLSTAARVALASASGGSSPVDASAADHEG